MKEAKLRVCKDFVVGETDPRLFGSFVEHMGSTIYNGIYQPGHPAANKNGFRTDVLDALKELNLAVVRYPGGNFVSGYTWEDGIGPLDLRPTRLELAWKAIEPNSFGLHEYMKWMELLGANPLYTVNLGTRGAAAARNIVEYCNCRAGTKYADMRRANGRKDPFGIKLWCLGNEMDGPWQIASKTAYEYGRIAFEAGKLMKWVDPAIQLVAAGSSLPRMSTYPEWDRTVLMQAYEVLDYISLHNYIDRTTPTDQIDAATFFNGSEPQVFLDTPAYLARTLSVDRQIAEIISVCDSVRATKRSRKTINLCFDEWNVISTNKDLRTDYFEWTTGCPIDCTPHTMEDSLAFASAMMAILRRADRVKIACQSLLVNTGPLVFAEKDGGVFRNSIFFPFLHISSFGRGLVLQSLVQSPTYSTEEFDDVPVIDTLPVFNPETEVLTVFAVSRSKTPVSFAMDFQGFGTPRCIEHIVMKHEDLRAINTASNPDVIQPAYSSQTRVAGDGVNSTIDSYSWNVIRFTF